MKAIGPTIDNVYKLRERYYRLKHEAEDAEARYKQALAAVYDQCLRTGTSAARGNVAAYSFTPELVPTLKDPSKFFPWVARKRAFDLLHRAVNTGNWREYIDARLDVETGAVHYNKRKQVPGVVPFERVKHSLRKRS